MTVSLAPRVAVKRTHAELAALAEQGNLELGSLTDHEASAAEVVAWVARNFGTDAAAVACSPNIILSPGTTLDVSGAPGFALSAGQVLRGNGNVTGGLTAGSGVVSPGLTGGTGTLTFVNENAGGGGGSSGSFAAVRASRPPRLFATDAGDITSLSTST